MQKKILVVDDEPNNLRVIGQILRDRYEFAGFQPSPCTVSVLNRVQDDLPCSVDFAGWYMRPNTK